MSGHSEAKLKRIKNYWLDQRPPSLSEDVYRESKYLIFDGTYFHKNGCLAVLIDYNPQIILSSVYIDKESYHNVYPVLISLKEKGLNPKAITMDGHRFVIQAILEVWPEVLIQRCLFHIQRQGLQWLRVYPKTEAGRDLRTILSCVTEIKTGEDKEAFIGAYSAWHHKYRSFIKSLPRNSVTNVDLKKAMGLINNALPDMFHYLEDPKIPPTTNLLENLYSQLKHHYRRHRGLTERHKISYLSWFCYLKNHAINNNL
jgi:transposase-like protein